MVLNVTGRSDVLDSQPGRGDAKIRREHRDLREHAPGCYRGARCRTNPVTFKPETPARDGQEQAARRSGLTWGDGT
jgi:hypothetical protein